MEFWSNETQRSLFTENSALLVANTKLLNVAGGEGDTVNKPILSHVPTETYTPGTDLTERAIVATNETLSIATFVGARTTVDDTEKKQSHYDLGKIISYRMMKSFNNKIEQAVLTEVTNASWSLDAGNVGGSSGSLISVNTDNVPQVFTAADSKLDAIDAPKAGRVAVVGSHTLAQLKLQQAARQTSFGDNVNLNGSVGKIFGWDVVYNNNLPFTAVLSLVTQPTDADTITIAGVVITLHATLIATAWADIRTNVDTTRTFIRDLINYRNGTGGTVSGTVDTDFSDVSAENRFIWQKRGLLAVDSASADTLTLTGYGDIVVSETLTDATDAWTSKQQDSLFCVKGAVDLVVQIPPQIEMVRDQDQFSTIVKGLLGYGKKTFADGAREMVRVKINAAASDWA